MKYIFLSILIVTIGCTTKSQTDYQWIRSHSTDKLEGAKITVKEKGNIKHDVAILSKMETANITIDNLIDSLSIIDNSEILRRTQLLINEMNNQPDEIKKFYNLTEQSTKDDFQLQLALLEFELLNHHSKYIGAKDISFDRLELRFIPTKLNNSKVTGELIFTASSNYLVNGAKMFVNDREVQIKDRAGLVEIPVSELKDGKIKAKISIEHIDFELEEELMVIKK